ncbi:hypothetical protein Emed_000240 [Eimeria media]
MSLFAPLFKGDEKAAAAVAAAAVAAAAAAAELAAAAAAAALVGLPVRPVLGPTSLDCELAFVMCNQGLVEANHVVLDPFVGTGGLLIAAAHYGACCFGADIDIRVLKGYGVSYINPHLTLQNKNTDIFRNFDDYGLRRPEIIRCDNAAWVGLEASIRLTYIPPTVIYNSRAVVSDLLNLSSRLLVDGGRLVFLLPVELSSAPDTLNSLSHEDLDLVATSLQQLSGDMGRVLVTMRRKARVYSCSRD